MRSGKAWAGPEAVEGLQTERGDLGAKSGRGFFEWSPGDAQRRRAEINQGLVDQSKDAASSTVEVGHPTTGPAS